MRNDVYQVVTDRIIALLELGTVPWHRPWNSGGEQQNLVTKKPYRGINIFLLNATRFASPFWLTFKQAQDIGARVKKGERSFTVVFWKILKRDGDGKSPEDARSQSEHHVPLLRYYKVFNADQCENVSTSLVPKFEPNPFEPIERCDQIAAQMPKRPRIIHGGERAAYSPVKDEVTMPNTVSFALPELYYSTLFHELTHATGHASRIGRKEVIERHCFASDPYSREELVAEMGAAFLCGHCGIENKTIQASAAYIQNWLEQLRNDRKLVVNAAAQAQTACDFIRRVEFAVEGGEQ